MKKKKSRIPEFKNLEEEAHFWDTHSITSFENETENAEIIFDLKKEKPHLVEVVLQLQKDIKDRLTHVAKAKRMNISSLAQTWITERLAQF